MCVCNTSDFIFLFLYNVVIYVIVHCAICIYVQRMYNAFVFVCKSIVTLGLTLLCNVMSEFGPVDVCDVCRANVSWPIPSVSISIVFLPACSHGADLG